VNLQEYYTQIDDLLEQSEYDALSPAEQAALGADYNTYVNDAAKAIAAGIVNKVTEATKFTDHFIRTLTDTSNPYQVVFYDYRDQDAPISKLDGDAWDTVELTLATQVMVKNNPMELTRYGEDDYWIQVAANSLQGVEIEFPDTRLEAIGMKDYTVFPEGYCSVTEDKKFDASALAGATKIGEHRYQGEVGGTPGVPVSTQYTVSGKRTVHDYEIVTEPAKRYTDRNGEKKVQPSKSYVNITGSHEESYSYTYTKTEYIGGTPGEMKEFYAYEPDTLLRVDRAISSLSESRSYLGAMTNRLEHAYLNDTNISENLQSAESRIRDTDMAEEAVALARDNILEQAGISMLAQANQMTQGVVELLR
jgi:flagellin-like hook-associated protein FlgL